ncbi:MAG: hypothetical protein GY944_11320 [bacterium]|nr:hypothetical protein [bacterium]
MKVSIVDFRWRHFRRWLPLLLFSALACATPSEQADSRAREIGLTRHEVAGVGFVHAVYASGVSADTKSLHVYIAGDGVPSRAARYHPPDPTPTEDPTFALMALDPSARILLGRPCHHITGACDSLHFTLGRYGEPVVASMAVALRTYLAENAPAEDIQIVLIGLGGGGTIAALIAERLPEATHLVTLAGNLDTDAWAKHHGHPAPVYSLNPSERPSLGVNLRQRHLRGGRDENVPLELGRAWIERQPDASEEIQPDFDHACCWESIWPRVLSELLEAEPRAEASGLR